ncbi:unnamed protein product [Aureobasidium uvarum]|uniref:Uncharacterized protein n=1 Tax=Aureobasidium uvarum TaxID=2773716 RepID=A0A9N8PVI1_9PEZI|nr:unnamed protein product [Aureobasidium uvarum]
MASSSSSNPCWSDQVYEAFDMLSSGNHQGAISALHTLRRDSRLPRFWRIQVLALLANAVEDWNEAEVRSSRRVQAA